MRDGPGFERKMAALAALGFRPATGSDLESEVVPTGDGRYRVTSVRPSMGTLVSITAIHTSLTLLQEAAGRAFQEMDRVVALLNRYDPSSAVGYLNAEGELLGPPPELSLVLARALSHHRLSRGAFDPTVQPLVDLYREAGEGPSEPEIREAVSRVDGRAVEVASRAIRFARPDMGITLDGIAKGYVVDRIAAVLEGHGVGDFLVNAGGDILARGVREDGLPWRVGVQDPAKEGSLPDVIPLSDMAVATSGSYEIYFDPERTRHHIVAAGDGSSPGFSESVSVLAPSAMEADALATSVFLMSPEAGRVFVEGIPCCACLIVDGEGREYRSSRWISGAHSPLPKAATS